MIARTAALQVLLAGLFVGSFPLVHGVARAQQGSVHGVVLDSAGHPIRDADIGVAALRRLTKSDVEGRFALAKLPAGEVIVSVRHIGYAPMTITKLVVDTIVVVEVQLEKVAMIEAVQVTASEMRRRFWVEDFYRRVVRGVGTYFTRADIERNRASTPTDLMRSVPGIQIIRTRSGRTVRFMSASSMHRNCMPMIWLDGQQVPGMQLDDIPLNTVEGIELYNGPSTTPMQFSQASNMLSCGTIVIWTRIPGT